MAGDAFGNALGSSLAARSSGTPDLSADDWDKLKQSALSGPRLVSGFGGEPNTQSDAATLGDMTYASARAAERSAYVATVIGASDIVDDIPRVIIPGPGPSWIQRNILTPAGQLISQVGDVLSDAGQGLLSWANDTFVRPSGSTDEMPQYFQYSRPSVADVDATQRAVNSYHAYYPSGPAFVAVDPAREASARAQTQRNGNNLAMAFGGYFVAAPMLGARKFGLNETQVGEAGMLGWTSMELLGARGGGPRPPSFPISRAPTISLANYGANQTASPSGKQYSVAYEVQLNEADWGRSDKVHFNRANADLDRAMMADPAFAAEMEKMSPGIVGRVSSVGGRETPLNFTWHHDGAPGIMQLTPTAQHAPGSIFQEAFHPDPGAAGGYAAWAVPFGAPPRK